MSVGCCEVQLPYYFSEELVCSVIIVPHAHRHIYHKQDVLLHLFTLFLTFIEKRNAWLLLIVRLIRLLDCLFIYLINYLFLSLFAYLFVICVFVHLFVCLSVCFLVCLFIYLFVCLFVCLFACLFVCLFVVYLFVYSFICLFVCLFVCLLFFFACLFHCIVIYHISTNLSSYSFRPQCCRELTRMLSLLNLR